MIDEEIKTVLSDAHGKVRMCLASHKEALERLAKLLLEKEVVERPQLQAILKSANGLGGDSEQRYEIHEQSQIAEDHKAK